MTYVETKNELINEGYDWLSSFDQSIDELVYETIDEIENDHSPYNPYLLEKNITALSKSLDKILALRTAANDLEDKAFNQALEYEAFEKNANTLQELEVAAWIKSQRQAEVSDLTDAVNLFSGSEDGLAPGFGKIADSSKSSSELAIQGEDARAGLINQKWEVVRGQKNALQERHTEPGNALNYKERSDRIRAFIKDELCQAYLRATAVSAGALKLFKFSDEISTLPRLSDFEVGYLDALVLYTRQLVKELGIRKQNESVFEHVVALAQPMNDKVSLITADDFNSAMNSDGELEINLANYFPDELGDLRVLGLNLSMSTHWSATDAIAGKRMQSRALVFIPDQPDLFSSADGAVIKRPPVLVSSVHAFDPSSSGSYIKTSGIENTNPKGIWKIRLADHLLYSNRAEYARTHSHITDIKIHFLLASKLDVAEANWSDFWY